MNESYNTVFVILAVLLIALLACGFIVSETVGKLTQANSARVAEAHAREAQARAITAAAQVEQERAAGERAVLEAAARSVDGNTALVAYYAQRGDTRAALFLALALLVALWFGERLAPPTAAQTPPKTRAAKPFYTEEL